MSLILFLVIAGLYLILTTRKFGLGLVVSTQQAGLLPKPVVFNAFTKIVMRLDKTEIRAAARSLEIDDLLLCIRSGASRWAAGPITTVKRCR